MANYGNYPDKYLTFNTQASKQLALVVKIEGITSPFAISNTYTTVRYGGFGVIYGLPGLVWGGLQKVGGPNGVGGVKPYIILDSGLMIGQRIEPEQGKGNIGTINLTMIDKNGEISYMIAPGNVVDEIMTSKQVTLYLGFQQTSFPEDYLILYRGYITSLDTPPGLVRFQISDGIMKSRQPVFNTPTTNTTSALAATGTTIPVLSTLGFYEQILGPNGTYDSDVYTYIKIDEEIMSYAATGITSATTFEVTRGAVGTTAAEHEIDAQVSNIIEFGFDGDGLGINFVDLSLKLLLSGWGDFCETDIPLAYIGWVPPGPVSNAFVLSVDDASLDLGLTVGDYFEITGASNGGNNIAGVITGFDVLNSFTTVVYTDQVFIAEFPTSGTASFRSKYDTFPLAAGAKARMRDVDVSTFEQLKDFYFDTSLYDLAIFYNAPAFAKDIIASDLFLPFGCYQISRYGRISMSVTKPPLPGITGKLVELNYNNVIDPDKIHVVRATNNRSFYNVISYQYDFNFVTNTYATIQYYVDTISLNNFNQTLTLPISSKGMRSRFGAGSVANIRGRALLTRYKNVALIIELTCNWSAGSLIEVSDIVLLNDNGNLKIMNFENGERNIGAQLFEVIDRQYNIQQGTVKLKLIGGLGFNQDSRFGLISPSSILDTGSTGTLLRLTPSYGQTSLIQEIGKWTNYIGLPCVVHSPDYAVTGTSVIIGTNATDVSALDISPDLGFTPSAGYILEVANYPTDTNKNTNSQYKALYTYITPSVVISSGTSDTEFDIPAASTGLITVGNLVIVRKDDWSAYSQEVKVSSVSGTTVVVAASLENQVSPFNNITPNSSYYLEGIGFKDSTGYYRYS